MLSLSLSCLLFLLALSPIFPSSLRFCVFSFHSCISTHTHICYLPLYTTSDPFHDPLPYKICTDRGSEAESQKKSYCVMEDIHGALIAPKQELQLQLRLQLQPHSLSHSKPSTSQHLLRVPDFGRAFQDLVKSREVGEFLSGALAGAMTKAILAPLETIRTRMVVGVGSKNISGSFLQIIEQQGWQGLWAGNTINMIRIVPTQAIELGTFEYVKRVMSSAQEKWNKTGPELQIGNLNFNFSLSWVSPVAVAGAAAGIVSTLACHPLEVLKYAIFIRMVELVLCTLGFYLHWLACCLTARAIILCTRQ
ncbi:probable mitochondrial adenine nucleotide transporter BTL1 isoform X5 [Andrographis paniculata]|uniref:probable mitochondrial adenine nucleotide transporter BTL1 isoform X5 n=1 Tax=Andrographis paniculata TaxID=175694 RepID=UPI0021E88D98|nr:probable mitochondrial adenine nucleotide transporter BTL1 isoform X5 [Andrographis paniculata]